MKKIIIICMMATCSIAMAKNHDLGEQTYNLTCKNCHAPEVANALKAPAAFNKEAWAKRINEAKLQAKQNPEKYKSAWDYLLQQVKRGKGLMHYGGLCLDIKAKDKNCSDEAYLAAIKYMSQQQK